MEEESWILGPKKLKCSKNPGFLERNYENGRRIPDSCKISDGEERDSSNHIFIYLLIKKVFLMEDIRKLDGSKCSNYPNALHVHKFLRTCSIFPIYSLILIKESTWQRGIDTICNRNIFYIRYSFHIDFLFLATSQEKEKEKDD